MEKKMFNVSGNSYKAKEMLKQGAKYIDCIYHPSTDRWQWRFEFDEHTLEYWGKVQQEYRGR